jgi:hypothetical protein
LSANREVAERLATLDVSLDIDDRSPDWFAIDGIDAPRLIGSDGAAVALEATLDDEDDIDDARDTIRTVLDLPGREDPVGALHEAVAASDAVVRATDGSPFTTLFNRFTIDSNPMLRDAVA